MITLQNRVVGAVAPATVLNFTDDNVPIDPTGYTWTIEAARQSARTVILWTKTTGFVVTSATLTITWAAGDLGALTSDVYILEVIGAAVSGTRKALLKLTVDVQNG